MSNPSLGNVQSLHDDDDPRLRLDERALEAAKRSLEKGAVTPSYGPWREDIIKLLNDALATEIVCIAALQAPLLHRQGTVLADDRRGVPGACAGGDGACATSSPSASSSSAASPTSRRRRCSSAATPTTTSRSDLQAMIRSNLIAERVAIEAYSQMIALIGDKDSTTRRILESILSQEQEHADELSDWLTP